MEDIALLVATTDILGVVSMVLLGIPVEDIALLAVDMLELSSLCKSMSVVLLQATVSDPMTGKWNAARSAGLFQVRQVPGLSTDFHHEASSAYTPGTGIEVIVPKFAMTRSKEKEKPVSAQQVAIGNVLATCVGFGNPRSTSICALEQGRPPPQLFHAWCWFVSASKITLSVPTCDKAARVTLAMLRTVS